MDESYLGAILQGAGLAFFFEKFVQHPMLCLSVYPIAIGTLLYAVGDELFSFLSSYYITHTHTHTHSNYSKKQVNVLLKQQQEANDDENDQDEANEIKKTCYIARVVPRKPFLPSNREGLMQAYDRAYKILERVCGSCYAFNGEMTFYTQPSSSSLSTFDFYCLVESIINDGGDEAFIVNVTKIPVSEVPKYLRSLYALSVLNGKMNYVKDYAFFEEIGLRQSETTTAELKSYLRKASSRKINEVVEEVENGNPNAPKFETMTDEYRLGKILSCRIGTGERREVTTSDVIQRNFREIWDEKHDSETDIQQTRDMVLYSLLYGTL